MKSTRIALSLTPARAAELYWALAIAFSFADDALKDPNVSNYWADYEKMKEKCGPIYDSLERQLDTATMRRAVKRARKTQTRNRLRRAERTIHWVTQRKPS